MGSTRSHRVLPAATASTEKYEWRKYEGTHYNEADWAVSQAARVKRVWPSPIQIFSNLIRFVWLYFANILKILSSIMKEIARRLVLTQTISRFCMCQTEAFSSTLSLAVILSQGEKLAATSSQWYRFILANRALKKKKKNSARHFFKLLAFVDGREAGGVLRIERLASTSLNPFLLIGSGSTAFYNELRPPYFFWLRLFCALLCSCLRVLYLYRDKSLLERFNATLRLTTAAAGMHPEGWRD